MMWKENWVFPAIDTRQPGRVAVPLLAAAGTGRRDLHRQVRHRRLGAPLRRAQPVPRDLIDVPSGTEREDRPSRSSSRRRSSGSCTAATSSTPTSRYTARFPAWDFETRPWRPSESMLGDIGRDGLPVPPHGAGACCTRASSRSRPVRRHGRSDRGLGLRQPRPLVGLARRPHVQPPPLDLRLLRRPLPRRREDAGGLLPARPEGRRLVLDRRAATTPSIEIDSSDAYWLDEATNRCRCSIATCATGSPPSAARWPR